MNETLRFLRRFLKWCGSIYFGLALMTALAVAMGWATFIEREMGTPVAQRLIYTANWFYCLIGALGFNILCASVVRLPFLFRREKGEDDRPGRLVFVRRLIPFYLAHLGILVLLVGCWTTARFGLQARLTIPEGTAVERAIDSDSRLFDVELTDFTNGEEPTKIEIPFSGGPLNWADCASFQRWRQNVETPVLAKMNGESFFQKRAKDCASISQHAAFLAARSTSSSCPQTLYNNDGLSVEILDYLTIADYLPVRPLKLSLTSVDAAGKKNVREIEISFDPNASDEPLATSRRARRTTLENGTRIVYLLADSNAELDAFLASVPDRQPTSDAVESQRDDGVLVLIVDGRRYQIATRDLEPLARSGSLESQRDVFETQRDEIERRLKLERERTDVDDSTKPLQTVSSEELNKNSDELRKLTETIEARASESNSEELKETRREYSRRRVLNYLATSWAQLENGTKTSKEFCETLETMATDVQARIDELERLDAATRLGDSGWKIVAFEKSPTLVSENEPLQGWTAFAQLESPQGDIFETILHSDLFERNRYPESGRVFGAFWTTAPDDRESEYGRPWSPTLGKPKLEFAQSQDGTVVYRYDSGRDKFQTGRLELTSLNEREATFAAAQVSLEKTDDDVESLVNFVVSDLTIQTELGVRLSPIPFQQDFANEFYGRAKIRVRLDDAVDTFWIRTLPLESATPEQEKYLTKIVASPQRSAKIRLTDRALSLGVALFVKKFTPLYEPGSSTAASFSSVVRALPSGLSAQKQAEIVSSNPEDDVVIQMNRPGVLSAPNSNRRFWAYQDSFRGPFKPGDAEFDDVIQGRLLRGETTPRDSIYQTVISLNADPGRGPKYFGSFLIVLGTTLLIYRPKNKTQPRSEEKNEKMPSESNNSSRSTILSLAVAAMFFATSAAAQETPPTNAAPVEKQEVASSSSNKTSQPNANRFDWTAWRRLPVFDGGRRQPLEAFADVLVRDVCGTDAPTFYVSAETLKQLEGDKPLNFPSLEEFLKGVEPQNREAQTASYREVSRAVVARQREIAAQLRLTFPNGARKYDASELLFSWIVEPEIWVFVPFIADPNSDVARNVLQLSPQEILQRGGRLAPQDIEKLDPKTAQPLVDLFKRTTKMESANVALKSLVKFERRLDSFRSISYLPTQAPSTRPRYYLNRILFASNDLTDGAFHSPATSLIARLDESAQRIEQLISALDKDLAKASPFSNPEFLLRKRTPVAGDPNGQEVLLLARHINALANAYSQYPAPSTGKLFEELYLSTTNALSELKQNRDDIFATETFSLEYRKEIQRAVGYLSEIVDFVELAYLSLTCEPSKTLDVAPLIRRREFRLNESQESPWAPLQTLLWAPDSLYVRFVDPSFAPEILQLRETPPADQEQLKRTKEERSLSRDELTISPFATFGEALSKTIEISRYDRAPANAFLNAALAYRDKKSPDSAVRFNDAIRDFADSLRALAERAEPLRKALAAEEPIDESLRDEFLAKTAYPEPNAFAAEIFYYRLNPFYWNWIACLFAVVAFAVSYSRQALAHVRRRNPNRESQNLNRQNSSVQNLSVQNNETFEEKIFFSLGLSFLALSCGVAFLGGAVRAYITGWAPVTNMFETVVLLAFLIATIAIGYALFPIWGSPFVNAWRSSAFPCFLRNAKKEEKRASQLLCIPRLILILLCVGATLKICYSEEIFESGLLATVLNSFEMQGFLDRCAIFATFISIAWVVPRFCVSTLAIVVFPRTICRYEIANEQNASSLSRRETIRRLLSQILQRKAFLTASAFIAFLVAASAYFNASEFNPNIRPLAAVLRSNFWLTIHVFAIILSYALGSIAWILALTAAANYIFGRYSFLNLISEKIQNPKRGDNKNKSKKSDAERVHNSTQNQSAATISTRLPNDWEPLYCRRVAPILAGLIRSAILFLTIGIILGARWADFSWGRFWSWDPKEVWALVTLLIYLVVLHALKAKNGGNFGLTIGAIFGALAIITTWYGLSFVMGGQGRHAYAAGESSKVVVLYVLFGANVFLAAIASARYWIAKKLRR